MKVDRKWLSTWFIFTEELLPTHTHNAQINTCFCGGVSLTMAYVCTVISHKYEAPDVCIGRMPYIRRICSAGCPHSCQDFSSKQLFSPTLPNLTLLFCFSRPAIRKATLFYAWHCPEQSNRQLSITPGTLPLIKAPLDWKIGQTRCCTTVRDLDLEGKI